jgi:hypothetical protein
MDFILMFVLGISTEITYNQNRIRGHDGDKYVIHSGTNPGFR